MELREAVVAKTQELDALQAILAEFPNTKSYTDRWGHVYYTTPDIPLDHPDLQQEHRRSCGCCTDSAYQVSLYLKFGSSRIYPEGWHRRIVSYSDWRGYPDFNSDSVRADLSEKGLPSRHVDSIVSYLEFRRRDYEDEEE